MKRTVIVFGLIAGIIMSVIMNVTVIYIGDVGFDRSMIIGYTTMVAAFLLIYFGIRSYRDNVNGGYITFGRGLVVGLGIVMIASLCYVVSWDFVYRRYIPDFGQRYTEYMMTEAKKAGKSDAELLRMRADAERTWESYKNPLVRAAYTIVEPLPVGLVIALISAGILRKKRKEEPVIAARMAS